MLAMRRLLQCCLFTPLGCAVVFTLAVAFISAMMRLFCDDLESLFFVTVWILWPVYLGFKVVPGLAYVPAITVIGLTCWRLPAPERAARWRMTTAIMACAAYILISLMPVTFWRGMRLGMLKPAYEAEIARFTQNSSYRSARLVSVGYYSNEPCIAFHRGAGLLDNWSAYIYTETAFPKPFDEKKLFEYFDRQFGGTTIYVEQIDEHWFFVGFT